MGGGGGGERSWRLLCGSELAKARVHAAWRPHEERWSVVKQEEPKSMIFTSQREYDLMRMFSGFRSQWIS